MVADRDAGAHAALSARFRTEDGFDLDARVFTAAGDDVGCERLAINGAVESVALWWRDHPELTAETLADLLTRFLSPGLLALSDRGESPRRPARG